jgi:alginate O-acetyltransferase complex protein AlgJ
MAASVTLRDPARPSATEAPVAGAVADAAGAAVDVAPARALADAAGAAADAPNVGATAAAPSIEGRVNIVKDGCVKGWAWRPARPSERVEIEVFVDGMVVAYGRAAQPRASLREAGVGDGAHGFQIDLPAALAAPGRRAIDLRAAGTGERLAFSASYRVTATSEEHPFAQTLFVPVRRSRGPDGSGASALLGRDGWLFLVGDSNGTLEQLAGVRTLSAEDVDAHRDALLARRERLAELGVASLLVLAPMKERVYRELLPDGLELHDELRPATLLARALGDAGEEWLLDLLPVLREARAHGHVYNRTDHHWSSRGAFVAAQAMLARAHRQAPGVVPLPPHAARFRADPLFGGDLAEKPKVAVLDGVPTPWPDGDGNWSETVERIDRRDLRAREVAPEPYLRRSPTRPPAVFERPDAPHLPRCLLVGDSFSLELLPWLAESFSRLAFVWLADPPLDLVERERPDLLLQVKSERFLLARPG